MQLCAGESLFKIVATALQIYYICGAENVKKS